MKPGSVHRFEFAGRELDFDRGIVTLRYRIVAEAGELAMVERFDFGPPAFSPPQPALEAALDALHWVAGVSYWKLACAGSVHFADSAPDERQAGALESLYRGGLAELAWRNRLERRYWPDFSVAARAASKPAAPFELPKRTMVPMGGGKDSLVALARVRRAGVDPDTVQVGSAELIARVAARAGTNHRIIARRLDPRLAALNAEGALNGHVPITAINAAALVVAALLWGFDSVVFANERSADSPTLVATDGRSVNHQFAKSHAFEVSFDRWVRESIAPGLAVFSILRRDRELAVCREFAGLREFHDVFSSCNRNFHLDGARTQRWCGECPKCRFVFLGLAPFVGPGDLRAIFGNDLLADSAQAAGFAELLALDGPRPFECVGEADEARAAIAELARQPAWREHAVVRLLSDRLQGLDVPALERLLEPGGPDCTPARFAP